MSVQCAEMLEYDPDLGSAEELKAAGAMIGDIGVVCEPEVLSTSDPVEALSRREAMILNLRRVVIDDQGKITYLEDLAEAS